jgi:hypothetical protein
MDSLRPRFNTLFDYNLEQQHEELKRFLNHHTEPKELKAITKKTEEAEQ